LKGKKFANEDDVDCIERFLRNLLELINMAQLKYNIRYMCEYFIFLHEFIRGGADECDMAIRSGAIRKCIRFYLAKRMRSKRKLKATEDKPNDTDDEDDDEVVVCDDTMADDEDDDDLDVIPIQDQKSKVKVFEKIISLITMLIEYSACSYYASDSEVSRNAAFLSPSDRHALIGSKNELKFFHRIILDDINLHNIRNLVYIFVHFEPALAEPFVGMVCNGIRLLQMNENVTQFFNILGEMGVNP
jgi:hypothetical protein